MPTIRDALSEATRALSDTSPSPGLDAEVLLSHVLERNRTYLRAWPEAELSSAHALTYASLIDSRRTGIPVAYIAGTKEFWSRDFLVSPDVLIPRPETELLIEVALEHASNLAPATLLDLATGSGAIAVTLAAEVRDATVYASDVSVAALDTARLNAERHDVSRIHFFLSDWFDDIPTNPKFSLIVSNPPYIAESDPHLQQGDVRFEPSLALRAGADGFAALRIIAAQANGRLVPGGRLLLEHGYQQAAGLRAVLASFGYRNITHHQDLQGHLRVTGAIWPGG